MPLRMEYMKVIVIDSSKQLKNKESEANSRFENFFRSEVTVLERSRNTFGQRRTQFASIERGRNTCVLS
jgi:hypothetical protein